MRGADLVRLDGIIMTNGAPVGLITPAGTFRCSMAEAIARWVRTDLGAALAELGSVPVAITNGGSYNCRGRNNDASAKISEYGRGNAFDLGPVKLADGAVIDLSNKLTPQSFRQRLRDATCNRFSTVLGPRSDPYHANHIHLDTSQIEHAVTRSANGMSKGLAVADSQPLSRNRKHSQSATGLRSQVTRNPSVDEVPGLRSEGRKLQKRFQIFLEFSLGESFLMVADRSVALIQTVPSLQREQRTCRSRLRAQPMACRRQH